MKRKIKYILCPILILFISSNLNSAGILVNPSFIRVQNVVPGEKVQLIGIDKCFLKVINRDNKTAKYKISLLTCKEYGKQLSQSYEELPDTAWLAIKTAEVTVEAGKTAEVNGFSIKTPKKIKFYNKKWQSIVKVEKVPSPGEVINLEVIIPLWIETQTRQFNIFEKIFPFII